MGAGCPIIAVTDNEKTFHQLSVAWNVMPILVEGEATPEDTLLQGIAVLKSNGTLDEGDVVVLSGGAQTFVNEKSEKKVIGGILRV